MRFFLPGVFATLLSLLLIACDGSNAAPGPAGTPTDAATPTAKDIVASSTLVPPEPTHTTATSTPDTGCTDPYPDGAPYEPTPGEPLKLVPTGNPGPVSSDPYPYVAPRRDTDLERIVDTVLGEDSDRFSLVIKDLASGSGFQQAPERVFYAASLYKTWVMVEAFNQQASALLSWDETYVTTDYYESWGLNPGELQACESVTAMEAMLRMMGQTDNVAANMLLDRVGSVNTNRSLESLGMVTSGLLGDNSLPTTARDMALLLEAIHEGALGEGAGQEMLTLLKSEAINDRIPALLPAGNEVAHKTGNWENATHDAGIVFSAGATYLMVVLSDYGYTEPGAALTAELSRAVYDYYN